MLTPLPRNGSRWNGRICLWRVTEAYSSFYDAQSREAVFYGSSLRPLLRLRCSLGSYARMVRLQKERA